MDHNELLQGIRGSRNVASRNAATLNRQVSTLYYAMFHCICSSNADVLAGSSVSRSDWICVYRALNHRTALKCCRMIANASHFDTDVQTFARLFERMQLMRLSADYDPDWNASDFMVGFFWSLSNKRYTTSIEYRRTSAGHSRSTYCSIRGRSGTGLLVSPRLTRVELT